VARAPLTPAAHLPYLERAVLDFAAVLEAGDLDVPVPACAPWRLRDLAHHVGNVHRWARTAVIEARVGSEPVDAPLRRAALVAWFRSGADALLSTLRTTDPDTPSWAFGPLPHTASFWFRRQAHENSLHAGDAAAARGATRPYGAVLAADGVDEVVSRMFPHQVRLGRIPPLPVAVALAPTEGGRWVLAGDGTACPDTVDATVSGSAEAMQLLLWHRTGLDDPRLTTTGDRAAAEVLASTALTP
jgi:uncharacterized protein (TIGR03083 family)